VLCWFLCARLTALFNNNLSNACAELNVEDKLVLMNAGGNKAKALCHGGAITCSTYDSQTQTPITGSYDMTVKIWNYDNLTAHAQVKP